MISLVPRSLPEPIPRVLLIDLPPRSSGAGSSSPEACAIGSTSPCPFLTRVDAPRWPSPERGWLSSSTAVSGTLTRNTGRPGSLLATFCATTIPIGVSPRPGGPWCASGSTRDPKRRRERSRPSPESREAWAVEARAMGAPEQGCTQRLVSPDLMKLATGSCRVASLPHIRISPGRDGSACCRRERTNQPLRPLALPAHFLNRPRAAWSCGTSPRRTSSSRSASSEKR